MDINELDKSEPHSLAAAIEYLPNCIVQKTVLRKLNGNVSIMAFEGGIGLVQQISPFDNFVHVIEGYAQIVIEGSSHLLQSGDGVIIPAHTPNSIKPNGRFKMIVTTIKSGYEQVSL